MPEFKDRDRRHIHLHAPEPSAGEQQADPKTTRWQDVFHAWFQGLALGADSVEQTADAVASALGPKVDPERTITPQLIDVLATWKRGRVERGVLPQRSRTDVFEGLRRESLREVLDALGKRPDLRAATIEAADPAVAPPVRARHSRAHGSEGLALWRASERRAATLYRRAVDNHKFTDEPQPPELDEALARAGSGQALPAELRRQMETAFGVSFTRVRVHTDAVAIAAAEAVNAEAFTIGEDVFFGAGAFDPQSSAGQKLIAHELTHVVQGWQGRTATPQRRLTVSQPEDALEQEAERVASGVVAQTPANNETRARGEATRTSTATPINRPATDVGASTLGSQGPNQVQRAPKTLDERKTELEALVGTAQGLDPNELGRLKAFLKAAGNAAEIEQATHMGRKLFTTKGGRDLQRLQGLIASWRASEIAEMDAWKPVWGHIDATLEPQAKIDALLAGFKANRMGFKYTGASQAWALQGDCGSLVRTFIAIAKNALAVDNVEVKFYGSGPGWYVGPGFHEIDPARSPNVIGNGGYYFGASHVWAVWNGTVYDVLFGEKGQNGRMVDEKKVVKEGEKNVTYWRLGTQWFGPGTQPNQYVKKEAPPASKAETDDVQRKSSGGRAIDADAVGTAQRGISGTGGRLPHFDQIQASFGRHDLSDVQAHVGGEAAAASAAIAAQAYAIGNSVAFVSSPDLHTAAHEAAHVVQQRNGVHVSGGIDGGASDPFERQADAVADAVVAGKSAEAILNGLAESMTATHAVQRAPQTGSASAPIKGKYERQPVGEWLMIIDRGGAVTSKITVKRTLGMFESEAAAVAAVKANGTPGAVAVELNKFVAYETDGFNYRPQRISGAGRGAVGSTSYAPKIYAGIAVLISNELMEVRPAAFDPSAPGPQPTSAKEHLDSTKDPFAGFREALGDKDGDLNSVPDQKLLAAFEGALKSTALVVLNRSAAEVKTKQERFSRGGKGMSDTEFETIKAVAGQLEANDKAVAAQEQAIQQLVLSKMHAMPPRGRNGGPPLGAVPTGFDEPIEKARAKKAELDMRRRVIVAQYPLLSRVDPAKFKSQSKDQMAQELGGEMPGILRDIEETKQNVADGAINLWEVDSVVDAAIAGFGLGDKKRGVIDEARKKRAHEKKISKIVFSVFMIGFGLAAMVFSGGTAGLFFTAGAFGLGTYDAVKQTNEYSIDKPASNVSENKDGGFAAPPGFGWLVVAWIGVGLDSAQVVHAVGTIARGEKTIAQGARELGKQAQALGMTEETLVTKLRQVAGDVDGATKFGQAHKSAVAGRMGIAVDIDPELIADVRVLYSVEKDTGRLTVQGLKAGPQATLAEVLAHENVVSLMRRYEGETSRIRELWNKILVVAGKGKDINPFPKGSKAWEAWFEVKKLPELAAARILKYGDGAKDGIRAANESTLAADLEFLEEQRRTYQKTIDDVVLERGVGFVADSKNVTQQAIEKGYPLPKGVKNADQLLERGYYYRNSPQKNGRFEIVRKGESEAASLRVDFDAAGKPVGFLDGELSRAEEADALLKQFPKKKQAAFDALKTVEDAKGNKVVPIKGIAATPETIGTLTAKYAPGGATEFKRRLVAILRDAYKRKGDVDAAKKAARAAEDLMQHPIVVIKGTDQLRAYGYRAAYLKQTGKAAEEVDDLHHMIPLYLGGDHTRLIDIAEDLHRDLHDLIEGVHWDKVGTSLGPSSIQRAELTFKQGAAVLHKDGTVSYDLLEGAKASK